MLCAAEMVIRNRRIVFTKLRYRGAKVPRTLRSPQSMLMPMVNIGVVRMGMFKPLVPMWVRVRFANRIVR